MKRKLYEHHKISGDVRGRADTDIGIDEAPHRHPKHSLNNRAIDWTLRQLRLRIFAPKVANRRRTPLSFHVRSSGVDVVVSRDRPQFLFLRNLPRNVRYLNIGDSHIARFSRFFSFPKVNRTNKVGGMRPNIYDRRPRICRANTARAPGAGVVMK
ncbi:hypothetical protein EVAR_81733_1 [Eumeta japonica]|uniref:Uncharacterized protein n=1 Tax=Eumeta variegata TaxID=151549 RepID=A0A4C1UIQ2_EUMVA|nr:hypothetical protein EVAR_81733_1 [Eumeta japonica]